MMYSTQNKIVDEMSEINLTGNIIPQQWYKTIVYPSGKPHLNAIIILSDIVYWYRPRLIRDERSGQLIEAKKRFKADLLQRSYAQIAEQFGITKLQASRAVAYLESLGVIKRVFKTIMTDGIRNANVLFIELVPSRLKELTFLKNEIDIAFKVHTSTFESKDVSTSKSIPPHLKVETNTKTTSKITSEITKESKESKSASKPAPKEENEQPKKKDEAKAPPEVRRTFDELIQEYTGDHRLQLALKSFVQMRLRINKPLTNAALVLICHKLSKLSSGSINQQIEMLEDCVINNWIDVRPRSNSFSPYPVTAKPVGKRVSAQNYEQREYTDEFLNSLFADLNNLGPD